MRKPFVAGITALALLGAVVSLAGTAGATAPTKPPVKLAGGVNNKGTKAVKADAVTIEQGDYFFKPTFLKAKAGTTVKVTVKNGGSADHTFTIDSQNIDETLSAGETTTVDVTVPTNGKPVVFYCRFHGSGGGMQGAFFTKTGAKAKATDSGSGSSGSGGY